MRMMNAVWVTVVLLSAARVGGQEIQVERVDVSGEQYLRKDTLLYYVSTKTGDRYEEQRVKEDFRRLWDTGFLENLELYAFDGAQGKIVIFKVTERKRVQIVDYRGSKALTTTNIEDKLKEKEAVIRIDSFYDPVKCRKTEAVIREMLEEKGRRFGSVRHDAKTVGGTGVQISFIIDDGPKTRVREIDFAGNRVFSDGRLRRSMKKIKQYGFWNFSWITGKSSFTQEKWEEDQKSIQDFFLNRGYVQATVGQPSFSYVDQGQGKKAKKWIKMEIPITEGDQFRIGEVKFEGLTVFREEGIRPFFKLTTGDVYKESRIKKGLEKLRDLYGGVGYFNWTGFPKRTPDLSRKVVDIVLSMEEDKRYFVGRIRFTGNDTTRDKVIRREVYLNEGEVFNTEALKLSIRRINQLGYFRPMEKPPDLAPSSAADDRVDVTFKVEEQNRNQFTFGGGYSGLEGAFLNASFSTANFLGLGETFQVSLQTGKRSKNYQIAITEPYFLDRPITAGFDVYKRSLTYLSYANVLGYTDARTGLGLVFGIPLGRFTRLYTNYSFEFINISNVVEPTQTDVEVSTTPLIDPLYFGNPKTQESRVLPSIVYNTVDNPWTPRSGVRLTLSAPVSGGPLGGDLSYFKPNVEGVLYWPHTRKTALGMRAEVGWILPFGDSAKLDPRTGLHSLPLYQRYFLGGEMQLRGYDVRAVAPTKLIENQMRAIGGNRFFLFNAEYYFDVMSPVRLLLFFDAGKTLAEGSDVQQSKLCTSTGVELRFLMPVLNVPFRLIYAINPNRESYHPKTAFKFAVGTTF